MIEGATRLGSGLPHRVALRKMALDAACWCGSSKPWGECHKDRAKARPIGEQEALAKVDAEFRTGRCCHPDAPVGCSGKAIRAHSLQRATALAAIAEKGHVYRVLADAEPHDPTLIDCIGVGRASTFFGFCNAHDTKLFLPIERGALPFDRRAAFLLTFRAVAMETMSREASSRALYNQRADAGRPLHEQEMIVNNLQAQYWPLLLGAHDFAVWKARLDAQLRGENYDVMRMLLVEFDGGLPIVSSAAIQPWLGFNGTVIQDLIKSPAPEKMAFCLTYSGGRSVMAFCWEDEGDAVARRFLSDFGALADDQKATAAGLIAMAYSENTFLRPSWWDGFHAAQKERIREITVFGTGGPEGPDARARVLNLLLSPFRIPVGIRSMHWL